MTDPAPDAYGCTIGGRPAMPILVAEHNDLVTRLAQAEALLAVDQPVRDQLAAAIEALGKSETELAQLRATLAAPEAAP